MITQQPAINDVVIERSKPSEIVTRKSLLNWERSIGAVTLWQLISAAGVQAILLMIR